MDQQYVLLERFSKKMVEAALMEIDGFFKQEPITLTFPESETPQNNFEQPIFLEFKVGIKAEFNVFFDSYGSAVGMIAIKDLFTGKFWCFSYVRGQLRSVVEPKSGCC